MAELTPFPIDRSMSPSVPTSLDVLFVCTGNATRSVLAAALLRAHRPDLVVASAGTLVIEGCALSTRTRAAFESIDLAIPPHRSMQATAPMLEQARAIVALAPEHIDWVRREHPQVAGHTVSLKRLHRDLESTAAPLRQRVADLSATTAAVGAWEEVVDPGGREVDAFIACAEEIDALMADLADRW